MKIKLMMIIISTLLFTGCSKSVGTISGIDKSNISKMTIDTFSKEMNMKIKIINGYGSEINYSYFDHYLSESENKIFQKDVKSFCSHTNGEYQVGTYENKTIPYFYVSFCKEKDNTKITKWTLKGHKFSRGWKWEIHKPHTDDSKVLVNRYSNEGKSLKYKKAKEYIKLSNSNKTILSDILKYRSQYKKDPYETTKKYNERINQIKKALNNNFFIIKYIINKGNYNADAKKMYANIDNLDSCDHLIVATQPNGNTCAGGWCRDLYIDLTAKYKHNKSILIKSNVLPTEVTSILNNLAVKHIVKLTDLKNPIKQNRRNQKRCSRKNALDIYTNKDYKSNKIGFIYMSIIYNTKTKEIYKIL